VWQLPSAAMHALHPATAFDFAASVGGTLASLPAFDLAAAEGMARWEAVAVASTGVAVAHAAQAVGSTVRARWVT
jgi:hypothetical protein